MVVQRVCVPIIFLRNIPSTNTPSTCTIAHRFGGKRVNIRLVASLSREETFADFTVLQDVEIINGIASNLTSKYAQATTLFSYAGVAAANTHTPNLMWASFVQAFVGQKGWSHVNNNSVSRPYENIELVGNYLTFRLHGLTPQGGNRFTSHQSFRIIYVVLEILN